MLSFLPLSELTEQDEYAYHEMMAHLPLFSHPCPKKVLIVGGGDGGILFQVCRHACVKQIVVVEIDPTVIFVAKQYFSTASAFNDERVEIIHQDGSEFIQSCAQDFDVILADTLDPVGPGESLFQPAFYECMHHALKDGGIVCTQSECFWINLDLISDVVACCRDIFDHVEYASTLVPSFPCGQTGFVLARKGKSYSCQRPERLESPKFYAPLRWYNPRVHQAAFVLPEFVRQQLGHDNGDGTDCWLPSSCTIL
jgi:spermidine synthase